MLTQILAIHQVLLVVHQRNSTTAVLQQIGSHSGVRRGRSASPSWQVCAPLMAGAKSWAHTVTKVKV